MWWHDVDGAGNIDTHIAAAQTLSVTPNPELYQGSYCLEFGINPVAPVQKCVSLSYHTDQYP